MSKIAYLVSDLGAASHTFVRREIAAVRRQGVTIEPFSIHGDPQGDADYHVILGRSVFVYIAAVFAGLLSAPVRTAKTWALSLRHRPPGLKNLLWSQFHFLEAVYLSRRLVKSACAHLHNHFANSGATVGLLASHHADISWSLTLHGISETDYPAIATLPQKIEAAGFVACASRFMMAQGMRLVDRQYWSRFVLVRCGLDLDSLPATLAPDRDAPVRGLCVGRLSPEKGYFGLLEALSGLDVPTGAFQLQVVGDGPVRDDLKAEVIARGLDSRIEFLGSLPEAETLREIAQCDFLILPSLMEGLPVVLIEARALGKPAIATVIAGIPELVHDEVDGLLFEAGNWQQLGRQIERLVQDPVLRNTLSDGASSAFPEEFTLEEVGATLAAQFREVTSGRP